MKTIRYLGKQRRRVSFPVTEGTELTVADEIADLLITNSMWEIKPDPPAPKPRRKTTAGK